MAATETNRSLITAIWAALAEGDGVPFANAMAEDFVWRMTGHTAWSGDYVGKSDVRGRMLKALYSQFATKNRNRPKRIHADGDYVIVESQGEVMTTSGKEYNNTYCFVIRLRDGQMTELTEYFDTALVNEALEPPPWA